VKVKVWQNQWTYVILLEKAITDLDNNKKTHDCVLLIFKTNKFQEMK